MKNFNRRCLLLMLLSAASLCSGPAFAKDGESGSSGSGGSGSGSDGADNSGSGNNDDDNDDDTDSDDADDDSNGGNSGNSGSVKKDHDRALNAVAKGKAVSLSKLKAHLKQFYPGKVLNVHLQRKTGTYYYRVRILGSGNRIKALTLNALTLKPGTV